MSRPRVVYWSIIPAPYLVGWLNTLSARGNLDLEAWFNIPREADRSWDVDAADWRFSGRYIPERSLAGFQLRLPVPELQDVRPDLLVSPHYLSSSALGSQIASALGFRTAFRAVPTYDTWFRRSWWKELAKRFLFRTVDGAMVPGPDGASVVRRYGVPDERIWHVPPSVDMDHYSRARDMAPAARAERREQLGLRGCVFLYVGRLWSGKGIDYLLDAYRKVRQERPDVSLLVVGDGVDEAKYRAMARDLPGVTFAGFVQAPELPEYYALADALVFPTLGDPFGLVVEEALAAGLPVISTEAAGDIRQRLPDGKAGYIVPPADAEQLAERMLKLATDEELRRRLAAETQRLVAGRGHEQSAIDFETFVERVLSLPRRRSVQALAARVIGKAVLAAVRDGQALAPYASLENEQRA